MKQVISAIEHGAGNVKGIHYRRFFGVNIDLPFCEGIRSPFLFQALFTYGQSLAPIEGQETPSKSYHQSKF
ncbi:hypothetical protein AVEN_165765-1 [Araneus ventricosus]|uniref:Uncharacterized protein n=1 Tax=Araneus ventricosus TaxID=182803 RepID=A0A4Y1ZKJ2_ARAVE|nr:hypothetical protein AVEN_233351-1 [Araneus ventricosus]GBL54903.1 hypothetical protein AVEN_145883-1 [Araneus ventricosus]GBL54911.1 hypothetical protein AVEN_162075-1 [Araneus ventricosus]GBL54918.1 hypothetical protein AVEN_165765-1 [Araneus ventricosus]